MDTRIEELNRGRPQAVPVCPVCGGVSVDWYPHPDNDPKKDLHESRE